jgi:hypothetical protein
MQRSFLRRYIERLALVSLPLLGAAACGSDGAPQAAADLAVAVVIDKDDLGCPRQNDGCDWLTYVDGGMPTDNPAYWFPDGGVNPCGPCGFEGQHGIYCGQCQVVHNSCGNAYFCSVTDCTLACAAGAGSGRRPPGLRSPSLAGAGLAHELVRMAHLEAASVPAFAQLAAELAAHRAPERLIAGARRARADEERHARVVGELARAAGARPWPLDVAPTPLRPLVEVARENAVEGCVRETAGAVVAARQARAFADPRLRRIFAAIAADERRHANLAWAVDDWARPRLSPAERRAVDAARAAAVRDLAG